MNYLKDLIFGTPPSTPVESWETPPEPQVIEKYSLSYRPYTYSGMAPIVWVDEWIREYKIIAINNNTEPYSCSTFPDFNEKIFDTEHYEQVIYNLEQKYTEKAFNNNNNIEIIKRIKPDIFNYNDKEYDFSRYEFIVNMTQRN